MLDAASGERAGFASGVGPLGPGKRFLTRLLIYRFLMDYYIIGWAAGAAKSLTGKDGLDGAGCAP